MKRDAPGPSESRIILLGLAAAAVMGLCILAILDTDAIWLALVTLLAMFLIALTIVHEMRGVITRSGDSYDAPAAPPPPGRSVLVCTAALTADEALDALGAAGAQRESVMIVAPEGLGGHGLMVDEGDYARARHAETSTVAALRRAGVNAAGHVGNRHPGHAVDDALALFPAADVVVLAREGEIAVYREHLDREELRRRTGAELRMLEAAKT
jgi:hypothetical protein